MPRIFSTHVTLPPIEWLKEAFDHKLAVNSVNIWKAFRHPSFIQVMNRKGETITEITKVSQLKDVAEFRVTQRGKDFLQESETTCLLFKKSDPPPNIRNWLSAFRRLTRNCPEGIQLTHAEGKLRILVKDTKGNVKDDDLHLVESVKVPWLSI